MRTEMSPLGAVVRGVIAAAAGTALMDAVWYARYRGDGGESDFAAWETAQGLDGWENAPAPAQLGKRVVEGLLQREPKPEQARTMTNVVHWGTGLFWGSLYGIVAGSVKRPKVRHGLLFGPLVWAFPYLALPPTGIYKPMTEYDSKTLWRDASAHLVYGLGTAAVFKLLAGNADR